MSSIKMTQHTKIFVGGYPVHLGEKNLMSYMSEFGEVIGVKILKKNGKSRGFGFVTFKDPETANYVIELHHEMDGKKFDCKHVVNEEQAKKEEQQKKQRKIFVGGMNKETTEAELKSYFEKFGNIERAFLNKEHDTNKSRGSGFVLFKSKHSVNRALAPGLEHIIHGELVSFNPNFRSNASLV